MQKKVLLFAAVLSLGMISSVFAEGEHKYIGVKKCSICHKSDAKGNQYKQWLSTKHAYAYETLQTEEAKKTAERVGVSGNPQEASECLRCHVAAHGVDESLLGSGFKKEDGVQCESCHGAGGDYMPVSIMKDRAKSIEAGLIMPTEEVCVSCHNEQSPTFSGFDFDEFYSKITHPRPE